MIQPLFMLRRQIVYTMLRDLFDEHGLPLREVGHLQKGDKIAVYSAWDEEGESLTAGEEFTIEDEDIKPEWVPLPEGNYRCQYLVTDITGQNTLSAYCTYYITQKDGERQVQLKKIE